MSALIDNFIRHFGEMGSRWGINRTVGQVYALLFLSEQPLHADDIAERLHISRSNVSMNLKELETWQIVRLSRQPGDRREYYSSLGDIWAIFKAVAAERRRREVEPTLAILRESLSQTPADTQEAFALTRMQEMAALAELANDWFDDLHSMSPENLSQMMRLGKQLHSLMQLKDRAIARLGGGSSS